MNTRRLKILYCTSHCPGDSAYGAQLRALHVGRHLQSIGDVDLLLFPLRRLEDSLVEAARKEFNLRGIFQLSGSPKKKLRERMHYEFDSRFLDAHGLSILKEDRRSFSRMAETYDVIWFHGVRIPNSLGLYKVPRSVLDIDDIASQYHYSVMKRSDSLMSTAKEARKAFQWARREKRLLERFDVITVCSEPDRTLLGSYPNISVIPNGFESVRLKQSCERSETPLLGFIGTLEYKPNIDGVRWFIAEVWPAIRQQLPSARLRLVGKNTELLDAHQDNINGLGWVQDTDSEIASWACTIVPIHIGGGTRIKIAEAFSRQCPVVSTRLGAYGYELTNGQEILLADTPAEFAEACLRVTTDGALAEGITKSARLKFDQALSWDAILPKVQSAINQSLQHA